MSSIGGFLSKFGGADGAEDASSDPIMLSASAPTALGAFMEKFTTLTESYWFYENTIELRFDTNDHKYYRVGELGNLIEQKGVTKTCHVIDRSVALVPWASKKCAEKAIRLVPLSDKKDEFGSIMLAPMTLEEFTKIMMEAKSAHKDILVEAGDIGHLAHKCLEDSIQHAIDHTGGVVLELRNLPEDAKAKSAAEAGFSWMQRHKVRWIKTEQKIYSREHEYAGTMDGSAWVSSCDDPSCCPKPYVDHRALIDWKSSNYLYIEYCYQTAAYLGAEIEEYGLKFDDRWILRLGKNEEEAGKFEPWYLDGSTFAEDFAGFLACLNLTKLVESVTDRMQVQKKGVRAAQKKVKAEQKEIAKMKAKVDKAAEKAQLKLDRAVERERIKAEAKKNREEAKLAKNNPTVQVLQEIQGMDQAEVQVPAVLRQVDSTESGQVNEKLERTEPVNEVPGQAKDTQADERLEHVDNEVSCNDRDTISAEVPKVIPSNQDVPVCEDIQHVEPESPVVPAKSMATSYEETPVVHRPFVIPEEG